MRLGCSAVSLASVVLLPALALAQTTRTAVIEEQVREKEQALRPYEPGKIESFAAFIESRANLGGPTTAGLGQGWYPLFAPLPLRGGVSFGAGYRVRLSPRAAADASIATSFRGYRQVQTGLELRRLGGREIDLRAGMTLRDYPRERFFGMGSDTSRSERTSYRLRDADYTVALTAQPRPWLTAGVDAGYLRVALRPGKDVRFQSIEQRFANLFPSGMGDQPDFAHARAFLRASTLDYPRNPREGGRYTVAVERHAGTGASFNRFDAEAMRVVGLFDKRRVIAVRGRVSIARPDEGAEIPFYLLPSLGGAHSLRGFDDQRFRDRNLILVGAEYRWEVFAGLDMALFVDAGKVTRSLDDLNLSRLHVSPGIGFRFNTLRGVIAAFDIAQGLDGRRYLVTFGPVW